jgi:hypothetical protein
MMQAACVDILDPISCGVAERFCMEELFVPYYNLGDYPKGLLQSRKYLMVR